ncbi:MAG: hypothetical protein LUD27_01430 [Clostridia bacterium]|nr:hypothetical protein [Clostridia bacterium]
MKDYSKIIDLPHHVSQKHPQMPTADRAAQFSSFAALKGYDEAVEEAARLTDGKVEISSDKQAELDVKLGILAGLLKENPVISITYFKPDERKSGGKYLKKTGVAAKVDYLKRQIVFSDGFVVSTDCVADITGDEVDRLYDAGDY